MDLMFRDDLGHAMLNALRELGEGINKLSVLEKNFSNCEVEEFDVMKFVENGPGLTLESKENDSLQLDQDQEDFEDLPPPPDSASGSSLKEIQFEEEIEESSCDLESNLSRRESFHSDEWENDDDLGYVLIPITEQEFFQMEEEVSFRHTLGGEPFERRIGIQDENDLHQEEFDFGSHSNDGFEHYDENELNQSFRNEDEEIPNSSSYVLDLRAQSPEPPTDKIESSPPINESESCKSEDEFEEDIAQVSKQLGIDQESGEVSTRHSMGSLYSSGHPNRRETEIWGQRKIHGVDGEHRYFDLKVIFEPHRTGFEEEKNFNPTPGTIVAGRYEVAEMLGQAAFSTAWQCVDLNATDGNGNEWVCLKVIKNSKDFFDQSLDEIKLLQYINSKGDPHKHNVLKMIDFFYSKEHLFIVSELLRENLYEFGKYIRESGAKEYFTLGRLKKIMKQILEALVYIHSLNLIHCDIKPENIVIKSYSRCEVKLIDFGSSCFTTDHLTSYIQSRSYRAPEVILGLDYGPGIDIWSLGGVLAEMHAGYVLFQNDSLATMLARIQGIVGNYPPHMLEQGREVGRYFSSSGVIYERPDDGEGNVSIVLIYPKKTTLRHRLQLPESEVMSDDEAKFLEFVTWMLQVDPEKRPSAGQALLHPWFDDVDLIDVTYIDT